MSTESFNFTNKKMENVYVVKVETIARADADIIYNVIPDCHYMQLN